MTLEHSGSSCPPRYSHKQKGKKRGLNFTQAVYMKSKNYLIVEYQSRLSWMAFTSKWTYPGMRASNEPPESQVLLRTSSVGVGTCTKVVTFLCVYHG